MESWTCNPKSCDGCIDPEVLSNSSLGIDAICSRLINDETGELLSSLSSSLI